MRNPFKGMDLDELLDHSGYLLGTSHKTELTPAELRVAILIQYMSPHGEAGWNLCRWMSKGCAGTCLDKTGRMRMNAAARMWRTTLYMEHREEYIEMLFDELSAHKTRCASLDLIPAVRLNGTTDECWEIEHPEIFEAYPTIQFYDYTKSLDRMSNFLINDWPANYHLTLSFQENACWDTLENAMALGGTVAMVFRKEIPEWYRGWPVVNGDTHDWRVDDPPGCIVGLKAKGPAKTDRTGFVVD
jgi:hypothetical protein